MQLDAEARKIFKSIANDRKRAEYMLLHFKKEYRNYQEERAEYVSKNGHLNELEGEKPTERTAINIADYDTKSEKYQWLQAVRIVERVMLDDEKTFLAARRAVELDKGRSIKTIGRPSWVIQTQMTYQAMMEKKRLNSCPCWLSEQQVKRWWQKIVKNTAEIALRIKK